MEKQRTLNWWVKRIGKITSSNFYKLTKCGKGTTFSKTAETYLMEILGERLSSLPKSFPKTRAVQWGIDNEPLAKLEYEKETGLVVESVGSIPNESYPDDVSGSPDGLVGSEGMIEIKCPNTDTHLNTVIYNKIKPEYEWQIYFNLWNTDRLWCDFVSYDPRIDGKGKIYIQRIYRNPDKDKIISHICENAIEILKIRMEQVAKRDTWSVNKYKLEQYLIENGEIEIKLDLEG